MTEKIEIRKLTPVIATISAGKTSLLNAIFNIKFLEVSSGIGTKFVNIIRYNPYVGECPIFYHLILKSIGKDNKSQEYNFFKDKKSLVKGSENIKKANKEINTLYKQKEPPFEEIFYMTEVGKAALIKDEEYLKNYDLVDIPGLSEYLSSEKEKKENSEEKPTSNSEDNNQESSKQKNKKIETSYLTGIFSIIKNKVNNGIILFDSTNMDLVENFDIINKLYKVIKKPIENYLILLNKIDKVKNVQEAIRRLEQKIMANDISGTYFNFTKNTVLPCSTFSLKNESNMENSFKHLIYFYFYNYHRKLKPSNETFLDYLKDILSNLRKKKNFEKSEIIKTVENFLKNNNLHEIIEEIRKSISKVTILCEKYDNLNIGLMNADSFNEKNIKENLSKIENCQYNDDSSDDNNSVQNAQNSSKEKPIEIYIYNLDATIIIIYFYEYFKENKYMPHISQNNKKIIEYFTMKNMSKQSDSGHIHIKPKLVPDNYEITFNNLKALYEKYEKKYIENKDNANVNYSKELKKDINSILVMIEKLKYFYFPIFGMNNVGKSTILNDLIGYDLLPVSDGITTKRGILIRYWDKEYPEINKVVFKTNNNGYSFEQEAFLGKGIKNVKKILTSINREYTNNKENFFYEIYTKIKLFEDNQFNQNLKDKICFIDLPGYGTDYKFENNIINSYLVKNCDLVLFIFQIMKKETNKKILNRIIKEMKEKLKDKGSRTDEALQYRFMFILNTDIVNELNKSEKGNDNKIFESELKESRKEIITLCGMNFSKTNLCILNGKNYYDYMDKLNKFENLNNYLKSEKEKYEKQEENFYLGKLGAKGFKNTFNSYLRDILKDEMEMAKNLSYLPQEKKKEKEEEKEIDKDIADIVQNYIEKDTKNERLNTIVSSISNIKYFNNYSKFLRNSNYDNFSKELSKFIKYGEAMKNMNLMEEFNSLLGKLNNLFIKPSKGKMPDSSILLNKLPELNNHFLNFKKESDNLLIEFEKKIIVDQEKQENIFVDHLKKSFEELKKALNVEKEKLQNKDDEKNNKSINEFIINFISFQLSNLNWLVSDNWRKIEDSFREEFEKRAKSLNDTFIIQLNYFSNTIEDYQGKMRKLFEKNEDILKDYFKIEELRKNYEIMNSHQEFKLYLKNDIDKYNDKNIEFVLNDIVKEIIEGSKEATKFSNCETFIHYIKVKFSNSDYLFKIIDYMRDKSSIKINEFIKNIEETSNKYTAEFIVNFRLSKNNFGGCYQELINKEDEKYKKEKADWEKFCDEYELIKNELMKYITNINNNYNNVYLPSDDERIEKEQSNSKKKKKISKGVGFTENIAFVVIVIAILYFIFFKKNY